MKDGLKLWECKFTQDRQEQDRPSSRQRWKNTESYEYSEKDTLDNHWRGLKLNEIQKGKKDKCNENVLRKT